jgi:Xaa-Pro aminopeptidase
MDALSNIRTEMSRQGISALLVSDLSSVAWLTGFTGSAGKILIAPASALFITDSRYTTQASAEVQNMPVASFSSSVGADRFLAEKAKELQITELGFEKPSLTYAAFESLGKHLDEIALVPVEPIFESLRRVKSLSEIEKVRVACQFADQAFTYILDRIEIGRTELDIHLELEFYIRKHGHQLAFPPIVVSGENSAKPHGRASDRVLRAGDFVTMDFGASIDGYNSDLTRTVLMGKADERRREIYDQVLKAEVAAIEAIKPGVKAKDVDALARTVLDEVGLAKYFGHGLGHGLGRLVHDSGRMSAMSEDVFEPGQIWTVEPGVYIDGFGGVRIEDDVVVVEGGVEVLTHSPKKLIELLR